MASCMTQSSYQPHPLRVQRRRTKGFRLPAGAICVTRPGPWSNPFSVANCLELGYAQTKQEAVALCVACFEDWLLKGEMSDYWWEANHLRRWQWMHDHLPDLRRKPLACFCPLDRPCHADVLAYFANRLR